MSCLLLHSDPWYHPYFHLVRQNTGSFNYRYSKNRAAGFSLTIFIHKTDSILSCQIIKLIPCQRQHNQKPVAENHHVTRGQKRNANELDDRDNRLLTDNSVGSNFIDFEQIISDSGIISNNNQNTTQQGVAMHEKVAFQGPLSLIKFLYIINGC